MQDMDKTNNAVAIAVDRLYKSFGNLKVLREISTEIHKGEVVAIIGPSGCGKSTFLRCLNLLEKPTSGTIQIDGTDITAPGIDIMKMRQNIGMVFQHFHLFPHMTVLKMSCMHRQKLKSYRKPRCKPTRCAYWSELAWLRKRMSIRPGYPGVKSNEWRSPVP